MPAQRYVSPELTHFVGKDLTEDAQYSVLINHILKAGWLKHDPTNPTPSEVLKSRQLVGGGPPHGDTEAMYSQVVCFCDIPVTDLQLHMNKYSRFGLSFLKPFLIAKGANPVLYVANNSPMLPFGCPAAAPGSYGHDMSYSGKTSICTRSSIEPSLKLTPRRFVRASQDTLQKNSACYTR